MITRVPAAAALLLIALAPVVRAGDPAASAAPAEAASAPTPEQDFDALTVGRNVPEAELNAIEPRIRSYAEAQPEDVRWKIALAVIERTRGRAEAAVESLKRIAKAYPTSGEARFQLGQSYMATLKPDSGMMTMMSTAGEAKDAWEEAVKVDPSHVNARYALAMYEIQARKQGGMLFGSYKAARRQGEALLKLPGDRAAYMGHLTLASVAAAQEEWGDMMRHFEAAERAASTDAQRGMAQYAYANSLMNDKKDAKAALAVADRAVKSSPDSTSGYFVRGSARKALGDCAGAMEDFAVVLERTPEAQNSRILMAQCCESVGDRASALAHYEEYLKRYPKGPRQGEAKDGIKRLKQG
jgi:tetratricopeptide (TPR) repeat protein